MKSPADAESLIALLDRHLERIVVTTAPSDWNLYAVLQSFLELLRQEPPLAELIDRYTTEAARIYTTYTEALTPIREDFALLFHVNAKAIARLDDGSVEGERDRLPFDSLAHRVHCADVVPHDGHYLCAIIDGVSQKVSRAYDQKTRTWREPSLEHASDRLLALKLRAIQAQTAFDTFCDSHPGHAYTDIFGSLRDLSLPLTDRLVIDLQVAERAIRLRKNIIQCQEWPLPADVPHSPHLRALRRAVRTLHLALVTDLSRGYSRDQLLERLARRFEVFDRVTFLADREAGTAANPDAWLTRHVARYLLDAGANPLVDPAVAGVDDDFVAHLKEPGIYVQAHYLPVVEGDMRDAFRDQVARMLAAWERLSETWNAPEALLVFVRGSGQDLPFRDSAAAYGGKMVRALTLNVAPKADGMGQASPQFEIADVLPGATVTELSSRRDRNNRKDLS